MNHTLLYIYSRYVCFVYLCDLELVKRVPGHAKGLRLGWKQGSVQADQVPPGKTSLQWRNSLTFSRHAWFGLVQCYKSHCLWGLLKQTNVQRIWEFIKVINKGHFRSSTRAKTCMYLEPSVHTDVKRTCKLHPDQRPFVLNQELNPGPSCHSFTVWMKFVFIRLDFIELIMVDLISLTHQDPIWFF